MTAIEDTVTQHHGEIRIKAQGKGTFHGLYLRRLHRETELFGDVITYLETVKGKAYTNQPLTELSPDQLKDLCDAL